MYKSYRDERDKMWSFKSSGDPSIPTAQENDHSKLRRRKLEVELSQLQNGQVNEQASVEIDLDQLNDSDSSLMNLPTPRERALEFLGNNEKLNSDPSVQEMRKFLVGTFVKR